MVTTEQIPDFAQLAQILIIEAERVLESARETETPPTAPEVTVSEVPADEVEVMTRRLEDLPKELGVLLTSVGVLGFVLPGIAGTPALIAGGLVLWPKTFSKVENWFEGRFPIAHRKSMQQVGRFIDDLDRRYPIAEKPGS